MLDGDFVEETRRSAEVAEVLNYVQATETALERIKERPISFNLIAGLQKILVRGTRGDSYDAGRLRERYVLIRPDNCRVSEARFIPPPHGDQLRDGLSDWEKWINAEDSIPLLVKVAAGHYQFETLHPFSDGNGRLGRLIAVLQRSTTARFDIHFPISHLGSSAGEVSIRIISCGSARPETSIHGSRSSVTPSWTSPWTRSGAREATGRTYDRVFVCDAVRRELERPSGHVR